MGLVFDGVGVAGVVVEGNIDAIDDVLSKRST